MIKTMYKYILIKKDIPQIRGKHVIQDARVGGEKLVYKRVYYPVSIIKISNKFNVTIPLVLYRNEFGKIRLNIKKDKITFLRPYKKNWAPSQKGSSKKDLVPFNLWGKKDHPLTNIWVELEFDYKDNIKSIPVIKSQIEDHSLIKFLRQHQESFKLIN